MALDGFVDVLIFGAEGTILVIEEPFVVLRLLFAMSNVAACLLCLMFVMSTIDLCCVCHRHVCSLCCAALILAVL